MIWQDEKIDMAPYRASDKSSSPHKVFWVECFLASDSHLDEIQFQRSTILRTITEITQFVNGTGTNSLSLCWLLFFDFLSPKHNHIRSLKHYSIFLMWLNFRWVIPTGQILKVKPCLGYSSHLFRFSSAKRSIIIKSFMGLSVSNFIWYNTSW